MDSEPNPTILDGSIRKDRRSQEMLYRQFHGYGMSISLRYTSTREEAVEVLNDGFVKVFDNLQQFDREKPFKSWFRRILINTAINHTKKYGKFKNETDLEHLTELTENGSNVLDDLSYQDTIKLIQSLSPAYRTIFNLYVIEGYSHDEIAETLQISVGASKSGLSRARENLRNLIKKNHEEEVGQLNKQ
ncbi:RNA polymerase sigma factor [Belliella marina]|uniref:RNA polymerase sigma factor n=1 Tax=Belliella marina TaxID=1644146 RepID=A0ABW4VRP2_9BACT